MRQAIQELQPQGTKPGQVGFLWPVFLSALMTLGGLLGVYQTLGSIRPACLFPCWRGWRPCFAVCWGGRFRRNTPCWRPCRCCPG